jgi:transposase
MIQTGISSKLFVAIEPIDFRKRMDGTAAVCRVKYEKNPQDGAIYIFRNRSMTSIRLYFFDGLCEWSCDLRIASGKFPHWPKSKEIMPSIVAQQFYVLIRGGDPNTTICRQDWKKIT